MFEKIKTKKLPYKTSDLPSHPSTYYDLPALTAGIENQGLNNYVPRSNATVLKNVISISANGANTGVTFYQNSEFTVLQDAYAIKWIFNNNSLSDNQFLFLTSTIRKAIYGNYDWSNKAGWEKIKNDKILLPITQNGEIDFKFMESFVAELEAERVAELEAYLAAASLKDYKLTADELSALSKFENYNWGEFRIGDLFEMKNTFSFNKEKLTDGNEYDYVTRTSNNQGILQSTGFVNARNLNEAGIWSLGLLQMDFFYRQRQWYAGQFVRKIIPKIKLTQNSILFFTTLLNSQKNILLSVLVRDVDKTFKNLKIKLPVTANDEIDFEFMNNFIKAIKKLVIKDVVLYTDNKIKATKSIVSSNQ
ncbi:restriction endonuclease subunit S [Campylobacter devanensis]|uniref:restriction endonuclease subunit S n=1 Tax=Campylobacter devanensis TaxID=3161138 RepID=UPI001F1C9A2C|nr:restriction endonuclease subunit S [Campylobacter sp. P0227]